MNDIVLQDIVDSVPIQKGDALLEIGPGIGNLTERLLQTDHFVLSIEKDKSFTPILKELSKKYKQFRFEIADILRFNFSDVLSHYPRYHVVANIPYYITGKIIQLLVAAPKRPETLTLLVQKEVAENVSAKPGSLNLLAISVQLFADVKILEVVKARDFFPAPKVDSAVIQIIFRSKPKYKITDQKKFFGLLRACFTGKRKQIHNTLVNNFGLDKKIAEQVLAEVGIDPQFRPQQISIEQWIALYEKINS